MGRPPAVFFLSDYGRRDEFVGVVHSVLHSVAPGCPVVDLTHEIPAFDVRAGAFALARTVGFLGPGVVLAVVDPGVGTSRRGVILEAPPDAEPRYFVGPDNGLLVPALGAIGGPVRAFELPGLLTRALDPDDGLQPVTFAGRDLFAPAVGALVRGEPPESLGSAFDVRALVELPAPVVEHGRSEDGRRCLRAEVTWIDHFGNAQLAAGIEAMPEGAVITFERDGAIAHENDDVPVLLRRVRAFGDLMAGEVGILGDANGHLAIVLREGSAAARLDLEAGCLVTLAW